MVDSYTVLLLHMNGAGGTTFFYDNSSNIKDVTAFGTAQISTAQSVFGGASGLFDGNSDYLSTADSADWYFDGDFTLDCRVRLAAMPANGTWMDIIAQYQGANDYARFGIYNDGGTYKWFVYGKTTADGTLFDLLWTTNPGAVINTWYHVAFVRNGNNWICFQDGTSLGTLVDADAYPNLAGSLYVGQEGSGGRYWNGYLDELRISKGIARWVGNFTPPTEAYEGAGEMVGETPIPPSAPFMPMFANPSIVAWCPTVAFTEINAYEVRLGSNGSMGSWSIIVPDQEGLLYDHVVVNDPIRIMLRQGPVERTYIGILESRSHVRSGRRRGNYLKIQGRGFGVYLLRRNKNTTYTTRSVYDIIANASTGLASACSEIVWGVYIRDPVTVLSTVASKRTLASVLSQCMICSGSATMPWTYWICHGEHVGEDGKPNLHFREKSYTPTPIVFTHHDVFSAERVSTVEFLQNCIEVEYGAAGLTEIRNDATSQTAYGIIYKYVYAPFLTTAGAADDWGDKWLYGSKSPLKAISLTVPFNLFVEPNLVVRYIEPTLDQQYEVSTVTHRGDERGARTIIYAGTTVL